MERKTHIAYLFPFFMLGALLLTACQKEERVGTVPDAPAMPAVPEASAPKTPGVPPSPLVANAPPAPGGPSASAVAPPPPWAAKTEEAVAIPLTWTKLATLEVEGYPAKTAQVEVGVHGRAAGKQFVCEIAEQHARYKTDAKWSPLPIILFNVSEKNEGLSHVFRETLSFPADQRLSTPSMHTFLVDFTRGNLFRALWRVQAKRFLSDRKPICKGQLEVCLDLGGKAGKFECRGKWKELVRLITHIDTGRHLRNYYATEREKNDLTRLELQLRDLDASGYPTGHIQSEDVPGFE